MIMSSNNRASRLRFNFGFLLEADLGSSRKIELDYPTVEVASDVTLSPLYGAFVATRTSEGVYISGTLHSTINVECMRCLDEMGLPIDIQLEELYYYPPSAAPNSEAFVFDGETGYIDLGPLVRELSLLEVPIQPICRPDCQGLCMVCGQNLNESDCGCEDDEIDPRMAKLRSLLE
jgi:uncharacterized protein